MNENLILDISQALELSFCEVQVWFLFSQLPLDSAYATAVSLVAVTAARILIFHSSIFTVALMWSWSIFSSSLFLDSYC